MIRMTDVQDRLYLSQGEENIYIDNCKIPEHHIEGIRFLYRQFKRKKPGVIINDPFGYGRNIQVILFLKAIRPLLSKPVLILCAEGTENNWVDRFYRWTDFNDEVVISNTNPAIKKMIIINTMENLRLYCGREWSILIVDSDENASVSQILKLPFNAEFKIWNTAVNMKENLDHFSEIYNWIYPNEVFDKFYFIPNCNNAVDFIEKTIFLDSFMEDIVLRRDDLTSSFEKYHREVMNTPETTTTVVSKKNKDATGTKIKRSKVKTENVAVHSSKPDIIPKEPKIASVTKLMEETTKTDDIYDNSEDFSIDNFKRKMKRTCEDVQNEEKESQFKIIQIDNSEHQSDLKLYYEPDTSTETADKNLEEMDTLAFGNETFSSQDCNADDSTNEGKASASDKNLNISEPDEDIMVKPNNEQTINKFTLKNEYSTENTNSKKIPNENKTTSDKIDMDAKNNSESLMPEDETKINLDELDKEIKDLGTNEVNIKKNTKDINSFESITEIKEGSVSLITKDTVKVNVNEPNISSDIGTTEADPEQNTNSFISKAKKLEIENKSESLIIKDVTKVNELNKGTSDMGTKMNTEQVANNLKRNNIDDKIKECEEKLAKKFKGSLLDSLF